MFKILNILQSKLGEISTEYDCNILNIFKYLKIFKIRFSHSFKFCCKMQSSPDSIYEYASNLDFQSLKNLCQSNKYFTTLCQTERFKQLIKQRYEETFPIIQYQNYYYNYDCNIYLNEGTTKILVALKENDYGKSSQDGKFVLTQATKLIASYVNYGKVGNLVPVPKPNNIITIPNDAFFTFVLTSVPINLEQYDLGLHYIYIAESPDDVDYTTTGFDLQKYLEYFEPEVLKRVNNEIEQFGRDVKVTFGKENDLKNMQK